MSCQFSGQPRRSRGGRYNSNRASRDQRNGDTRYRDYRDANHGGRPYSSRNSALVLRRAAEKWGIVTGLSGQPRRVFIKNIPACAKIEDLKDFFGVEKVEGVFIDNSIAHVQFIKPQYATEAVTRKGDKLFSNILDIQFFDEIKARRMSRESREPSENAAEICARARAVYEDILERPRSRSRSNSSISSLGASASSNQRMELPSSSSTEVIQAAQQSILTLPAATITTNSQCAKLPPDIDLILRMVICNQTARKLSIAQIEDVVNYLTQEKDFLIRGASSSVNPPQIPVTNDVTPPVAVQTAPVAVQAIPVAVQAVPVADNPQPTNGTKQAQVAPNFDPFGPL